MLNRNIFRKYDIRGIAYSDITPDVARDIGRAFGTLVMSGEGKRVVVGRDVRKSGEELTEALVDGLCSCGCDVSLLGMTATPVFYFALHELDVQGGIMVTASHNPPEYNGFKICMGRESLYGDDIIKLYNMITEGDLITGEKRGASSPVDISEKYISSLLNDIELPSDLKVILDCGNGSAGIYARRIFEKAGIDVKILFEKPDGDFPNHIADPTVEKNMISLKNRVVEGAADLGIGFDGDVDRIGVVDEKGTLVYGDTLLAVYAENILKNNPGGDIVFEVKCSRGLIEHIKEHGGRPVMWKAGHSLLKAKMKETDAVMGGEMSGHMFFRDRHPGYDDAFYGALRLLEIIGKEGATLGELTERVPSYLSTPEIRIDCPDEVKFRVIDELTETFRKNYDVIDIDGVRINFKRGWALIRPSNTQPVLVFRAEAEDKTSLDEYTGIIKDALSHYSEVSFNDM